MGAVGNAVRSSREDTYIHTPHGTSASRTGPLAGGQPRTGQRPTLHGRITYIHHGRTTYYVCTYVYTISALRGHLRSRLPLARCRFRAGSRVGVEARYDRDMEGEPIWWEHIQHLGAHDAACVVFLDTHISSGEGRKYDSYLLLHAGTQAGDGKGRELRNGFADSRPLGLGGRKKGGESETARDRDIVSVGGVEASTRH